MHPKPVRDPCQSAPGKHQCQQFTHLPPLHSAEPGREKCSAFAYTKTSSRPAKVRDQPSKPEVGPEGRRHPGSYTAHHKLGFLSAHEEMLGPRSPRLSALHMFRGRFLAKHA